MEKECEKEVPQKKYQFEGEKYICLGWMKLFTHQPNITKHILKKKKKQLHQCPECSKSSEYKCKLDRHLKYHTSSLQKNVQELFLC